MCGYVDMQMCRWEIISNNEFRMLNTEVFAFILGRTWKL
jgi:hypothetical protein